jgi:glycosyltransferase involved in cell wall biosynthesis
MKIAILAPGGFDRSGTERVIPCLLWFVERLVKAGDEVHVFTLRQEREPGQWSLLGATIHNAGGPNPHVRASRAMTMLLREHRRARFDVLHALWAVPQGTLAAIAGKSLRIPVLLHLPGGDIVRMPQIGYGGRVTLAGRVALRVAVAGADRIAAPSLHMVDHAQQLGIRAVHAPFGVALDRWPVKPPRRRGNASARLLHVADISPVKDQETLLLAAAALKTRGVSFVLDIIGKDTFDGRTAQRARELGLAQCVNFHGFLPQTALKDWMDASDLLVMSSRHEAGPIVALEAAVSGVPTVGTHVGLLADWAPAAACTVEAGDSSGLALAIADLLSNEAERLRLVAEAQKRAIAGNADVTTRRIRDLYLSVVEARRPGNGRGSAVHVP